MPKRARQCTAVSCDNKTEKQKPFCKPCFSSLNKELQEDLIKSWKHGNGKDIIYFTAIAREIFEGRNNKLSEDKKSGDDMVAVSVEVRKPLEKSWMIFDGAMKQGQNGEEEDWKCLPRKLCKRITGEDENEIGPADFEVPYWLAKRNNLI